MKVPNTHTVPAEYRVILEPQGPNAPALGVVDAGTLHVDVPVKLGDVQSADTLSFEVDRAAARLAVADALEAAAGRLRTVTRSSEDAPARSVTR